MFRKYQRDSFYFWSSIALILGAMVTGSFSFDQNFQLVWPVLNLVSIMILVVTPALAAIIIRVCFRPSCDLGRLMAWLVFGGSYATAFLSSGQGYLNAEGTFVIAMICLVMIFIVDVTTRRRQLTASH